MLLMGNFFPPIKSQGTLFESAATVITEPRLAMPVAVYELSTIWIVNG